MPEAARNNVESQTVSLEGLEAVFQTNSRTSEASEVASDIDTSSSEHFGTMAVEVITTEEAAQRLGISARAVLNRLKAGTLQGRRIKGKFKTEWRVLWDLSKSGSEGSEPYEEVTSEVASEATANENETDFTADKHEALSVQWMKEQVKQLTDQSQALSFRNGYLEAQLEMQRDQIKLLPDFQSKAFENDLLKARINELEAELTKNKQSWWQKVWSKVSQRN
jgi:predicted transcriptional regulator